MDPDIFAKEFEGTEENPRDVTEIRDEVYKTQAKEEEMKDYLPDSVKVSIFTVELKALC